MLSLIGETVHKLLTIKAVRSDRGDPVVLEIVQEERVKDVVEEVRMVFAGSSAIGHEVDLADHGLDRLDRALLTPVQHQVDGVHGSRLRVVGHSFGWVVTGCALEDLADHLEDLVLKIVRKNN